MVGQQAVCTDADEGFADEPVHCLADEGAGGIFVIRLQGIAQVLGQTGFEVLALTRTVIGMHQVRLCFFTDVKDAGSFVLRRKSGGARRCLACRRRCACSRCVSNGGCGAGQVGGIFKCGETDDAPAELCAFKMFDQDVKAGVAREDTDEGIFVLGGDLSEIVSEVEIKRVFAGFGDTDEVDVLPKAAQGFAQFDGQVFLLVFAKEEPDVAVIGVKGVQLGGVGLGVFEVNEDVLHMRSFAGRCTVLLLDELQQLRELVNKVIGAGCWVVVQAADVGVAEGNSGDGAACRFAGEDVVSGITDHEHLRRGDAERFGSGDKRQRCGFFFGQGVAAVDEGEVFGDMKVGEEATGEGFVFVGDDGERQLACTQGGESRGDAIVEAACHAEVVAVVIGEVLVGGGVLRSGGITLARIKQETVHEARDAIANVAFNAGNGQRGKPTGNAGGVGGGGKVGQGIAEGAIEIEGKGVDGHGVLRWV